MIGAKIRAIRNEQSRSLAEIANQAKISVATLSRIENNKQSVDLGLFLVLAKVLKVTPADILGREGEADGGVDPLARRIAALETTQRTDLWRDLAAERKARRNRTQAVHQLGQQVEELLAQIDFLRGELDAVHSRIRKKR